MSLVVNHNLMAANVANNLNTHYGNLATSTQRLTTGLRINSAADDAAGLAIRELMRADIATLHQGARNANDAISMIQTADGALAVIDEKLIRMKELAEQAATGTYDSVQRQMINSEFQQMASEIDRIANSTDFNGIHLLNGNLSGKHNGSGLTSTGAMKVHFGSGNDSAEDYYYIDIGDCTINSLIPPKKFSRTVTKTITTRVFEIEELSEGTYNPVDGTFSIDLVDQHGGEGDLRWAEGLDRYRLPSGLTDVYIQSKPHLNSHRPHVNLFNSNGTYYTGAAPGSIYFNNLSQEDILNIGKQPGMGFKSDASWPIPWDLSYINKANQTTDGGNIQLLTDINDDNSMNWEEIKINKINDDLVFIVGGHTACPGYRYDLKITAKIDEETYKKLTKEVKTNVTVEEEFDDQNNLDITTQNRAQKMLERIDDAIVSKDKIRAHLGAMQNRLENTITNITTQAENLQASESQISDVDVATEMTNFVRNQILAQSAVAMLSQANSMPQMAMQLIG